MKNLSKNKGNILTHVILIIGAAIMILPFLWMMLTSIKIINGISTNST